MMGGRAAVDILLVEADPDNAERSLRALREVDAMLRVAMATDTRAALDFLFCTGAHADRTPCTPPRLILLDLLSVEGGIDLMRRIRSEARTRAVPIVVLGDEKEPRIVHDAYRGGANSYLVRPAPYPDLVTMLGDLVRYWLRINQPRS